MLSAPATRDPFDASSAVASDSSSPVATTPLTPEFYQQNPFRQLGLPVLATTREVLRRVDQLKLSAELGAIPRQWAFAPREPLTADDVRACAQRLKTPRDRLVHELFWFWPENYPHDGTDAALEFLERDNTLQAGRLWSAAATQGHEVAWHNLAVYHHLLALEWEKDTHRDEASLAGVWQQVITYWLHALAHEKFWERVRSRVQLINDAQLPPDTVDQARARLPEAIAQINAALAHEYAQRGRTDRVALHRSLAAKILGDDQTRLARVLEATARPAARRIEQRVEKMRVVGSLRTATGLHAAAALVRECSLDLAVLETLCGASNEFFREQQRLVASAVLDEVVRYQRDSGDDRGCLPLLWYLRDFPTAPELATRINSALTVIQANALDPETGDANTAAVARIRAYRVVTTVLVPGLHQLGLIDPARRLYATRVAEWLKTLALEAAEEDDIDWAMQAMLSALDLPCDNELIAQLVATRDRMQQEFEVRRTKILQLQLTGRTLTINARGIALDGAKKKAAEITALRHGWTTLEGGTTRRYVVAWSADGLEFEIDETNFFTRPETAADDYARVVEAVYFFLVPGLVERLAKSLRAGTPLLLGDVQLDGAGANLMSAAGSRFWKRTTLVPHARVRIETEGHFVKISSADNPKLAEQVDMLQTWNAAIIGYVIARLAHA